MPFNPEEELKEFPCSFTLKHGSKVRHERYKHLQNGLQEDLIRECLEDERIRNKNILAWVLFCLNDKEESLKLSQEMLQLTDRKNITALGNYVYISFPLGYKIKSENCMKELRALENQENYEILMTEALAEQAYSYSRFGGAKNSRQSKELYTKCIEKCPGNYLWKYGLGLACRRLTKLNLSFSNEDNTNMNDLTRECVILLFEVAEHADDYLKGIAYSQLVTIRKCNSFHELDALFKGYSVTHLVNKALRFGRKNPVVLTECGKSLKRSNIDDAIKLLKESLALKEHNTAYSHLGFSYQKKARSTAEVKYFLRRSLLTSNLDSSGSFRFETIRQREFQSLSPRRRQYNSGYGKPREFQTKFPRDREFRNEHPRRGEFQNESTWRGESHNESRPINQVGTFPRFCSESPRPRLTSCKSQSQSTYKKRNESNDSDDRNFPWGKHICHNVFR